jgi:hypothetical protein
MTDNRGRETFFESLSLDHTRRWGLIIGIVILVCGLTLISFGYGESGRFIIVVGIVELITLLLYGATTAC